MITSAIFDTAIGGDYKRNNRSTRQKSLRCFPSCGIKGHVTGGFCGLPLKVTIKIVRETNLPDFIPEEYRFIAEIRPVSQPRISGAKHIPEADLLCQIRSKYEKNEANGELFQADNINVVSTSGNETEMELTFNSQHCSWDYSWKSNRWSGPQEQHVVDIIVLKSISAVDTRVVSFHSSSPFVVSSSHKKPVKTNQIKEEDDDELICLPAAARGRKNSRAIIRPEEGLSRLSTMSTSTLTVNHNVDIRGSYEQPWRQLTMSADGKTLEFSSCRLDDAAEEEPKVFFGSSTEQESVNEGALALIQLCVAANAAGPAPVSAPAPTLAQASVRKDKKSTAAPSSESSQKRVKTEESAPDLHHPYGYHHAYPPFPQYGGYPPPYPYPYPYSYPPRHEEDGGEGGSSSAHYAEHDYPAHMHRYPPVPPPGSHPSYMYPYPPFPYGLPPPPQGSKHAMPPYAMPPYGLGAYPPHPMHYPPPLPYPGSGYRPPGASSMARGEGSNGETESEAEDGLAATARRPALANHRSSASSRAPIASQDREGICEGALPVATPVPLGAVLPTAYATSAESEKKVLKFTKRTQRFGGASTNTSMGVSWDGHIAEAPAVRSIAPLERVRVSSYTGTSTAARSSSSSSSLSNSLNVERVVNSGSVTP